jgi:hypothetical protein
LLAVVLMLTLATPAKAEAFDVMTGLAIAGAAVIVLVIVAYLIIANVEGPKMGQQPKMEAPKLADARDTVWVAAAVVPVPESP